MPPGGKTVVAVEDATGLVVSDPTQFTAAQIPLQNQLISNGSGLAYCPNASTYMAVVTADVNFTGSGLTYSGYSTDGGTSWHAFGSYPVNTSGTAINQAGTIAISRRNGWGNGSDHLVWLPTQNYPPYYSKDGGSTWHLNTTFPTDSNGKLNGYTGYWTFSLKQRQLVADPFVADKYYLNLVWDGFYVSTDGGVTWQHQASNGLPTSTHHGQIGVNRAVQNDLWFVDGWEGASGHGLFHSTNGGTSFSAAGSFDYAITLALGAGSGLAGDQAYSVYVYGRRTGDPAWGVFRSNDGGSTWVRVAYYPNGIFDQPTCMAASWDTYGKVIVGFGGNSFVIGNSTGGTVPTAPTSLTASAGNAQVTLSWTASSGATSYSIFRGTTAGGESTTAIATGVTTTSYTNTGLTNGTTYYYEVKAVNSNGSSGYSNEASAKPVAATDNAVYNFESGMQGWASSTTNCTAATSTTQKYAGTQSLAINVTTTAADTASVRVVNTGSSTPMPTAGQVITYHIWVPTGSSVNGAVPFCQDANWTWTGSSQSVTAGQWNTLTLTVPSNAVTPMNAIGISVTTSGAWTGTCYIDSINFAISTAPPAPTGLTATAGNAQAALSWTASTGATSYSIFRGTTAGGESTTAVATGITTTSYTNTGLTNGTTYYYKVTAVNPNGSSGYSNEASTTPVLPAPAAPTGLTATPGNAQVALAWTASSGASSYSIFRGTTAGGESTTAIATGVTTTSYTNTGLTNGTKYYYEIKAVNSAGSSAYSNEASATPVAPTVPAAPTGLTATAGNTQVALSWAASSGATSYSVFRGTTAGGESTTAVATGITTTSYTNTGLTNGTTYYYKVTAVNTTGSSGYSNEASAKPVAATDNAVYNFESGMQGWASSTTNCTAATSTTQKYAGTQSLAINVTTTAADTASVRVVNTGSSTPMPTAGQVITYHIWVPTGSSVNGAVPFCQDANWTWTGSSQSVTAGQWNTLTLTVPSNAVTPMNAIGISVTTSGAWTGTCYIDSINFGSGGSIGALTGSVASITSSGTENLTTDGTADWAHWGYGGGTQLDHKSNGSGGAVGAISALTTVGSGQPFQLRRQHPRLHVDQRNSHHQRHRHDHRRVPQRNGQRNDVHRSVRNGHDHRQDLDRRLE